MSTRPASALRGAVFNVFDARLRGRVHAGLGSGRDERSESQQRRPRPGDAGAAHAHQFRWL